MPASAVTNNPTPRIHTSAMIKQCASRHSLLAAQVPGQPTGQKQEVGERACPIECRQLTNTRVKSERAPSQAANPVNGV